MNTDFWQDKRAVSKGIHVLAPMADVTDNPFRRILSEIGAPDVYWNEFVAADGLSHPDARPKLERLLTYEKEQRPIVAQIFSGDPDNCRTAGAICAEKGFDAVDINMGCPARNIIRQVSGSELSKAEHRQRVADILKATQEGVWSVDRNIPVSIKTRLGFNFIDIEWLKFLFGLDLPLLTLHLRTRKEMSKVPAHWELMTKIRAMRDQLSPQTVLIGNGDVQSVTDGQKLIAEHGIDGIMYGRALFSNPWLFRPDLDPNGIDVSQRIELALRHTRYFMEENTVDDRLVKNFNLMKKFFKVYIQGFDGAKELRTRMMGAKDYQQLEDITKVFQS